MKYKKPHCSCIFTLYSNVSMFFFPIYLLYRQLICDADKDQGSSRNGDRINRAVIRECALRSETYNLVNMLNNGKILTIDSSVRASPQLQILLASAQSPVPEASTSQPSEPKVPAQPAAPQAGSADAPQAGLAAAALQAGLDAAEPKMKKWI
ncbi:hypothetical protein LOTGIDRAFT_153454 [Lottia gigantea]|uniref:Uncharacterized protein n=1 Tax=Lottia gigantea TaxID=225164 RepID=V4AKA3_LOTGI|nr:hypothetical protein LOTGIDRAFT_153454 [Lottia gigantea]ESO93976.1 hypothetical protein LOTGIDRAFT_153454 [Lottia gigantea]